MNKKAIQVLSLTVIMAGGSFVLAKVGLDSGRTLPQEKTANASTNHETDGARQSHSTGSSLAPTGNAWKIEEEAAPVVLSSEEMPLHVPSKVAPESVRATGYLAARDEEPVLTEAEQQKINEHLENLARLRSPQETSAATK